MGLSCSVAWKTVVRWTDSAASFLESRLREPTFFRVVAFDRFEEADFGTGRPLEADDLGFELFFEDFFAACEDF